MTRALIFAAGFGHRLSPITDETPKPLVSVNGKPLIQYHIEQLKQAGVTELVINTHWLADQLVDALGTGSELGVSIQWSHEPEILNTGGGMKQALPLLGKQPFLVINADIWTDYPLANLLHKELGEAQAHIVLVPNPDENPAGDFVLNDQGLLVLDQGCPRYTYAGIGLYSPDFIDGFDNTEQAFPLLDPLVAAISEQRLSGEIYRGDWSDIGTMERLETLRSRFAR